MRDDEKDAEQLFKLMPDSQLTREQELQYASKLKQLLVDRRLTDSTANIAVILTANWGRNYEIRTAKVWFDDTLRSALEFYSHLPQSVAARAWLLKQYGDTSLIASVCQDLMSSEDGADALEPLLALEEVAREGNEEARAQLRFAAISPAVDREVQDFIRESLQRESWSVGDLSNN